MDFGGFWICCSTKNLLLNGIKISFLPIYSGFNPNSTGLYWLVGKQADWSSGLGCLIRRTDLVFAVPHGVDPINLPTIWLATDRRDHLPLMMEVRLYHRPCREK